MRLHLRSGDSAGPSDFRPAFCASCPFMESTVAWPALLAPRPRFQNSAQNKTLASRLFIREGKYHALTVCVLFNVEFFLDSAWVNCEVNDRTQENHRALAGVDEVRQVYANFLMITPRSFARYARKLSVIRRTMITILYPGWPHGCTATCTASHPPCPVAGCAIGDGR